MFLVFLMIFHPASGWGRAAEASRSVARVVALHLLPLLLLGCVAEGAGMMRWGKHVTEYGGMEIYTLKEVLRFEACQFAIGLGMVLVCALGLRQLGSTFHVHARHMFARALTVSVFGLGPVFLMRVCDAFPAAHPMVSWGIGAVLAASVLYQGVPRVMAPGPAHAAGVYLSSTTLLIMVSCIGRMVAVYYLPGKVLATPFIP